MRKVKDAIGDREHTVIVSDRHQGIVNAVKEVYPISVSNSFKNVYNFSQ